MKKLSRASAPASGARVEKVIQFGEGNFLRAFVDWIIWKTNAATDFNASVVVVQPIPEGRVAALNGQDGLYHLHLQGLSGGKVCDSLELIDVISRGINPYTDCDAYWDLARQEDIRFVISNTTEAGIAFDPSCRLEDRPASSYPGKLTQLLYRRFLHFEGAPDKGLVILPCELIFRNGDRLRECILRYAELWHLGAAFRTWFENACSIHCTLVDRIVPGYPAETAEALCARTGFADALLDKAEVFHLWIIEAPAALSREFPVDRAGLQVRFVDSEVPYHERKVTLLNGPHTVLSPVGYLCGLDTVRECCEDPLMGRYIDRVMREELKPSLSLPEKELDAFIDDVQERFRNPYIRHRLSDIMLNAFPKYKTRDLPALKDFQKKNGRLPEGLVLGLAAIAVYYRGDAREGQGVPPRDDKEILALMRRLWADGDAAHVARGLLGAEWIWEEDLLRIPGLCEVLARQMDSICRMGMRATLLTLLEGPCLLQIDPADNVAVALRSVGEISAGHKVALKNLREGERIIKYGAPIGRLTCPVREGERIGHEQLQSELQEREEYDYRPAFEERTIPAEERCFEGFVRADGQVGIRNQIWMVPTVGCISGSCRQLAQRLKEEIRGQESSVDDVRVLAHPYGCSQLGEDHAATRRILARLARHPNAGAVLVVGLGCENNRLPELMAQIGKSERIRSFEMQAVEDEMEHGMALLRELFALCRNDRRTRVPVSRLRVGLKCGGSDGLSGITANPLLGLFSDRLTAAGGTAVLSEVPEMFGAERRLMARCRSREQFDALVRMIGEYKDFFTGCGMPVYENPSPGNKEGGISTLEEKSLGCIRKGGTGPVDDIIGYGEALRQEGLVLCAAPGNDLVASTALAAAGCQLVLFTTGRGTPYGTCVPTMKIATNSALARRKPGWIDFDAGVLADGAATEEVSDAFFEAVLRIASGQPSCNERNGFSEIAIFKRGITL